MRAIGRILLIMLAAIGGITLAIAVIGAAMVGGIAERPERLPHRMVLTLDLDKGVVEAVPDTPFGRYALGEHFPIAELLRSLERAADDTRVAGLAVTLGDNALGMAQAEQIRRAVLTFRKSGKPAVLFSDSFGGTAAYHVATAFEEVWLQPSGDVDIRGFITEAPFVKDALATIGIEPIVSARHEYKSAPEIVTATRFSPEARSSLTGILASWTSQFVAATAERRNLAPEAVRTLMDTAPLMAAEALAGGLVDRLGYFDQAMDALQAKAETKELVNLRSYDTRVAARPPAGASHRIALIHGVGTIHRDDSHHSPVPGDAIVGADTMVKAFAEAGADEEIAGILFRVDSPGGDYVASDTIWRAVRLARDKGKPVVVSMGNTAASGGYFISMGADAIVAEPSTITGSIGVFAGKFVLRGLWDKLGVAWDEVHVGKNADMFSTVRDFTPDQRRRFEATLDAIYRDFTDKVAAARGLSPAEIDAAARGRVFSGTDAIGHRLIDRLGGISTALDVLREKANLPADAALELVPFPQPKDFEAALFDLLSTGKLPVDMSQVEETGSILARLTVLARPLLRHLEAGGDAGATLRLPVDIR